jgi:hypothetical protein
MARSGLSRFFAAGAAFLIIACPSPHLRADNPAGGNALALLDAYLAQAALDTPAYRADLKAGGARGKVPPGRLLGMAPLLGFFTYRPRTYGELARGERAALLHDPRFHAFLTATREQSARGNAPQAQPHPEMRNISITPGQMLQPGPVMIALPPP